MSCHTHPNGNLRLLLADARTELRAAKDDEANARAIAEQAAIDAAGGSKALGANADDRERALTIALLRDATYLRARQALRNAEDRVESLEAHLEGFMDARRDEERQVRAALAEALSRAGIQVDGPSEHAGFGAALTTTADRLLTRRVAHEYADAPEDDGIPF